MTDEPTSLRDHEWKGPAHRQTFQQDQPASLAEIERRLNQGWSVRAIDWVRSGAQEAVLSDHELPYGLRVAGDSLGKALEDDPGEVEVLLEVLSGISQDHSLSRIAETLNSRCSLQRDGQPWTQTALFHLLPRIIEVGPQLLASRQWREIRPARSHEPREHAAAFGT